jgi:hypothetical protein
VKNAVFWDVTPRSAGKNRRFRRTYHLHHQGDKNRRVRNNVAVTSNRRTLGRFLRSVRRLLVTANVGRVPGYASGRTTGESGCEADSQTKGMEQKAEETIREAMCAGCRTEQGLRRALHARTYAMALEDGVSRANNTFPSRELTVSTPGGKGGRGVAQLSLFVYPQSSRRNNTSYTQSVMCMQHRLH